MINPLNQANREVSNVKIDWLKDGKDFLFLDTANVTTQEFTGDSVFALARGINDIAFEEPMAGTLTIEAQVLPFKVYALMSDGKIYNDAAWSAHEKITATEAGKLTVKNAPTGTVYVYPEGKYADAESMIEGTASNKEVTAAGVVAVIDYRISLSHAIPSLRARMVYLRRIFGSSTSAWHSVTSLFLSSPLATPQLSQLLWIL